MIKIEVKKSREILQKQNIFEKICCYGATIMALIVFGVVAIGSIFQTSVIDPDNFSLEVILYQNDNVFINLLMLLCFFGLAFLLYRYRNIFARISERQLMIALAVYTIVVGMVWIIKVQCVPAADSGTIYDTAVDAIKGDWSSFYTSDDETLRGLSYYRLFPYQLGFVLISEIVYRIMGYETALPIQIINVLALAVLYIGLLKIAKKIFHSKGVVVILTFLLAACVQPILFTPFAYGNIIGFSAAIWSCYCVICFMQSENRKRDLWFIPAALLMALSIIAKYNNLIWLIAVAIGLIIYVVKTKKWVYLISVAGFCIVSILGLNLVIMSYEARSNTEIGSGMSQILQLDMGLNESYMAPGWYNGMAKRMYVDHAGDGQAADEEAKKDLQARKEKFMSDGVYLCEFFGKKILSQWNEPSYESLWVSQVKTHYYGEVESYSWLDKVYNGTWGQALYTYFDLYHMIVFVLFCVAMVALLLKRCGPETIMLITTLLGGFFYHLLFEAKSQYSLTYFILIVFFAAYGLHFLLKTISIQWKTK